MDFNSTQTAPRLRRFDEPHGRKSVSIRVISFKTSFFSAIDMSKTSSPFATPALTTEERSVNRPHRNAEHQRIRGSGSNAKSTPSTPSHRIVTVDNAGDDKTTSISSVPRIATIVPSPEFDALVFDLALRHSGATYDNLRSVIAQSLERVSAALGARYALLLRCPPDSTRLNVIAESLPFGISTFEERLLQTPTEKVQALVRYFQASHIDILVPGADEPLALMTPFNDTCVVSIVTTNPLLGTLSLLFGGIDEVPSGSTIRPKADLTLKLFQEIVIRYVAEHKVAHERTEAKHARLLGRSFTNFNHDFNNVLNTINCIADATLLDIPQNRQDRIDIEEIKRAAQRGTQLTRQLHTLAKSTNANVRPCDLRQVVASSIPSLNRLVGPEVTSELSHDSCAVGTYVAPELLELLLAEVAWQAKSSLVNGGYLVLETAQVDRFPGNNPTNPLIPTNTAELRITALLRTREITQLSARAVERLHSILPFLHANIDTSESRPQTLLFRFPQDLPPESRLFPQEPATSPASTTSFSLDE